MSLTSVFLTAVLPVTAVAGAGYALGRRLDVDASPLNTVTIHVLVPALVFFTVATTPIPVGTVVKLTAGVVLYTALMLVVVRAVTAARGGSTREASALALAGVFTNVGNYGIPLAAFAFGGVGRAAAVLFLVVQNVLMYTVGVYVASRGDGRASRAALRAVFRVPLVYAVLLGGLLRLAGGVPADPGPLFEAVRLTGESAIPMLLLILGIQLASTSRGALRLAATPSLLKLVVAPAIGVALALALGFEASTVGRAFVLGCAAPTAVTPLMLAIEYADVELDDGVSVPRYVGAAVFTTTLASIPALTVLIVVLQSGVLV